MVENVILLLEQATIEGRISGVSAVIVKFMCNPQIHYKVQGRWPSLCFYAK